MLRKRPLTSSLIFFVVVGAALCVWLLLAAPIFQEKERLVRSENAALAKDIAEIETMDGNTEELDKMIADTERAIQQKYSSRAETPDDAAARIEAICSGLGYYPSKIGLGPPVLLHPAGAIAPALYSIDITFQIESTEEAGAPVIRALESSASSDFVLTGFVYRAPPPPPVADPENEEAADNGTEAGAADDNEAEPQPGEWIFTVTLFFYE